MAKAETLSKIPKPAAKDESPELDSVCEMASTGHSESDGQAVPSHGNWQDLMPDDFQGNTDWLAEFIDPCSDYVESPVQFLVENTYMDQEFHSRFEDDLAWNTSGSIMDLKLLGNEKSTKSCNGDSTHGKSRSSPDLSASESDSGIILKDSFFSDEPTGDQGDFASFLGSIGEPSTEEDKFWNSSFGDGQNGEDGSDVLRMIEEDKNKDVVLWKSLLGDGITEGLSLDEETLSPSPALQDSVEYMPVNEQLESYQGTVTPEMRKGAFLLDLKKAGEKDFCFPEVQMVRRDESVLEFMRSNGLSVIQRHIDPFQSEAPNHACSPLLLDEKSQNHSANGCNSVSNLMPKFDFNLNNNGATEIVSATSFVKPIIINSSDQARPADMSARLAALVTSNSDKRLKKSMVLDKLPAPSVACVKPIPVGAKGKIRTLTRRTAADGTIRPTNPGIDRPLLSDIARPQDPLLIHESLLKKQLIAFAEAIAMDDQQSAKTVLSALRPAADPKGNYMQRATCYYIDALLSRSRGDGALKFNSPPSESQGAVRKAMEEFFDYMPLIEFLTESINGAIYEAVAGHKAVHIIDFGVWQGGQWPSLMERLAHQPGGPPRLRITAIDCPGIVHPGKKHATNHSTAICKHLSATAAALGMPFEYRSIDFAVERCSKSFLGLREEEVLAVSCCARLRSLYDGSVMKANPRDTALEQIRKLNPAVVGIAEMNLDCNGFFFMARFKESLDYFFSLFEAHDRSFPAGSSSHLVLERCIFARDIVNIVACEGLQRVVRTERAQQWKARFLRAGFQPVTVGKPTLDRLQLILRRCAKDFSVGCLEKSVTLEWKNASLLAASAWKPLF